MISLLVLPFLACLMLVLIHVYFGSFVLRRGILFIDLALAQWAALGYLVSHWLDIHSVFGQYAMAFGFVSIAAVVLSLLKPIYDRVNLQEAVIGVMYILATALATSLISWAGLEGHHLKEMLAGHLLFIQPQELVITAILYGGIGLSLIGLHRYFSAGNSRLWDFVFYLLFGAVVTSSVKMVGILLVFSYLVLPLLTVQLVSRTFASQLKLGWAIGTTGSILGLGLSMVLDIPPSYCVILVLCLGWGLSAIIPNLK